MITVPQYKGIFTFGVHDYVNNDSAPRPPHTPADSALALPILDDVWLAIEAVTGYAWRNSSFLRESPSHRKGHAIDLVPVMDAALTAAYAGTRGSDPVLHSRKGLLDILHGLESVRFSDLCNVIIAVESDHLHVQLVARASGEPPTQVLRWAAVKPIYKDSLSRNQRWETTYQAALTNAGMR